MVICGVPQKPDAENEATCQTRQAAVRLVTRAAIVVRCGKEALERAAARSMRSRADADAASIALTKHLVSDEARAAWLEASATARAFHELSRTVEEDTMKLCDGVQHQIAVNEALRYCQSRRRGHQIAVKCRPREGPLTSAVYAVRFATADLFAILCTRETANEVSKVVELACQDDYNPDDLVEVWTPIWTKTCRRILSGTVAAYAQYLVAKTLLASKAGTKDCGVAPCAVVDAMWHAHILNTRLWDEFRARNQLQLVSHTPGIEIDKWGTLERFETLGVQGVDYKHLWADNLPADCG